MAAINLYSRNDFRHGIDDCCQFVGKVGLYVTGFDGLSRFSYRTREEAQKILDGYGGMRPLVCSLLGEPVPIEELEDGDPLLLKSDAGVELLAVKYQDQLVYKTMKLRHGTGVFWMPIIAAEFGWNLPCL